MPVSAIRTRAYIPSAVRIYLASAVCLILTHRLTRPCTQARHISLLMCERMIQQTCEPMPTIEETYHPGAALNLYAWKPPAPPPSTRRTYNNGPPIPTQLSERYNKSIAERVNLPSTPPAVSITLENRLDSSTSRVPHVWTARVRGSSSHVGTTTTHTTYPPSLVAK